MSVYFGLYLMFGCVVLVAISAWWSLRHEPDADTLAERDRVADLWVDGRAPGDLGGDR